MTLTTLMPTLRASLPDPIDATAWPARTTTTLDDVAVAAVSMTRLADLAGTPCVHTAEQPAPDWRPPGWTPASVSVAVASVLGVRRPRPGTVLIELDAALPTCAVLDQIRLIGRTSVARLVSTNVVAPAVAGVEKPFALLPAPLPADVREGDLVCFPCRTALRHRDVAVPVRAEVRQDAR
ncbi:hypothetical protein [Curtobacterium sp. 9128]|uniref:hypothetical protein n=1 Tax=Curtobacterium sp. 9128 TaxID=1793722 RepID=UPI0011A35512|nr:hypothetical protein [Curtobacterium sp. 9128]